MNKVPSTKLVNATKLFVFQSAGNQVPGTVSAPGDPPGNTKTNLPHPDECTLLRRPDGSPVVTINRATNQPTKLFSL